MRNVVFGKPLVGEQEQLAVRDVLNGPILVHKPMNTMGTMKQNGPILE